MSTAQPYFYHAGTIPLIISQPHTATGVPPDIMARFTGPAKELRDTDWHIDRLYAFARGLDAHVLTPAYSRYVVDLNRAPDNSSLYPGKFTTGLCPLTLFDGTPIYQPGKEPDAKEIKARTQIYWQPYHDKLQSLIDEMKAKYGRVLVFDAHSICSRVPTLFDGVLPDLNIGTADGITADPQLCEKLLAAAKRSPYSAVYNGRFKGGYITRHYGSPAKGVHAVQLELAQKNYMNETSPFAYDETKAERLQGTLKELLALIVEYIS